MIRRPSTRCLALITIALAFACVRTASAQWQVESKDGKANVKFGVLAQPQLEVLQTADDSAYSQNLFLRRLRLLFGGKIADKWTFFVETDSPNVGKASPDRIANPLGAKDTGFIYLQDAFVTYDRSVAFKVDSGMILTPLGHNHGQSAATLLPVDYGPFTFADTGPLTERVGRDYGVQLRGYPLNQHFEYRLGVFQGVRGTEARNELRVAGRGVWYPFAADTGFFYGGTFHAARRVVAVGAGFDRQEQYRAYAADVFVEQPFNGGQHGLTAQFNWMRFDGRAFLKVQPKQDAYLVEAAAHFAKGRLSPFVQWARKDFDQAALGDQSYWQAGMAYWMAGHQRNLKFSAGRQHTEGAPDRTQVLVQLQIFYY
jgi:hypothetical protein